MLALQPSSAFSVECNAISDAVPPRLRLRHRGDEGLVLDLPGAVMEAQFEAVDGYLVFTTENTPYEEALHVHWIARDGRVLDAVELSLPYTPAIFANAVLAAPRTVRFTFFDDGRLWSVEVARTPRIQWSGPPYPARSRARWWRPGWLLIAVQ